MKYKSMIIAVAIASTALCAHSAETKAINFNRVFSVPATLSYGLFAPASVRESVPAIVSFSYEGNECLGAGEAFGNLSSERAYVRIDEVSCSTPNGTVTNQIVRSFVLGPDRSVGVHGTLKVTQGQMVAQSYDVLKEKLLDDPRPENVAVLASATGSLFDRAMNKSNGASVLPVPSPLAGRASETKIYPVIEVQGGQDITLVFRPTQI